MRLISKYKMKPYTLLIIALLFSGCFSLKYDMKGGVSIPPSLKTFSVQYFDNRAQLVEPTFSQRFTEELRKYVEANTNLRYVNGMGDVDFSGTITTYQITPQAISASGNDDRAAKTRFTISVKVNYQDTKDSAKDFEKNISGYRDFDSNQNFDAVESQLSDEIRAEIIEQIFNAAFINW